MNTHELQLTPDRVGAAATPYFTVKQFSERNPAFSEPAIRNLIFKAEARHSSSGLIPGNGLAEAGAILRVGTKVLVDENRFFKWVREQNQARLEERKPSFTSKPPARLSRPR